MRERYIAPAIMLVAGAITSILNVVNKIELLDGLKRLLLVLIIFYIVGKIVTKIIMKTINIKNNPVVNDELTITDVEQGEEE